MSRPRASGYFRTGYAQDLALLDTRTQQALVRRASRVALAAARSSPRPSLLDLANQVLLAVDRRGGADAAHRLRRPDLARPRRAARRRRLHHRHPVQGARRAVLGHAAGRRGGRRAARRDLRPAEPAPARSLPRRVDARAALHRHLPRQRVRDAARLLHRRRDRSAELGGWTLADPRAWYFVLFAAAAATVLLRAESAARAAPAAPGGRSTAARRWRRRSASTCPRAKLLGLRRSARR